MKSHDQINYQYVLLGIIAGFILGMITMFFMFTISIERTINSLDGVLEGVSIEFNFNETLAVDRMMNWTFNYWDNNSFKNFTTVNYNNCNGLLDKGCTQL